MQGIHYSADAILEALRRVDVSNIPDRYKRVLVEVVGHVLRDTNGDSLVARHNASDSWLQHEVQTVAAHLEGKVAVNWQHADELVMWLVACLRRTPDDIRKKATELGYGASVDYRIAKSLPVADDL